MERLLEVRTLPGGLPDGGDLHLWALPKGQHPSGASG